MLTPDSHDHEWFQVTVTLGNFDSYKEAYAAKQEVQRREDFVTADIKGSWH